MSNHRTLLVVTAAVLAALAMGTGVGRGLTEEPTPPGFAAPSADPSAAPSDARVGSPSPADASEGSRPGTNASDDVSGVEQHPEAPAASPGLPGLDSADPTRPDAWDVPTRPAAARGRIVTGYPVTLLPATPRATVVSSSVSPSRSQVQVALVARRAQSTTAVLRFYRLRLADAGFAERRAAAVGGARAAAFARGDDQVIVTVDAGATYSVYATLAITGN